MKNELTEIQKSVLTNDYIKDIKDILLQAKKQSYKSVNSVMIQAYWLIGWRIVEQEQKGEKRAGYGEKIIQVLCIQARKLTKRKSKKHQNLPNGKKKFQKTMRRR